MSLGAFSILSATLLLLSSAFAETNSPFRLKQSVQFVSRSEDKLLSIGKTSDFIGILERTYIPDPISKNIDIYEFKKLKNLQVSKELCSDLTVSVFGDSKNRSLEIKIQEIKSLPSRGKICYTALSDPSAERSIKKKHFYVVILNLRVFGLVFRHSQEPTESQIQDELKLIESLRLVPN